MSHICTAVPPYLLQAIADSDKNSPSCRQAALAALTHSETFTDARASRLAHLTQPAALRALHPSPPPQAIVPEQLLRQISESDSVDPETRARAARDAEHIRDVAAAREAAALTTTTPSLQVEDTTTPSLAKPKTQKAGFFRAVFDAQNDFDQAALPGEQVRLEGQPPASDQAANEAYDNVGQVLKFYLDKFGWRSLDGRNMPVVSSVHFGDMYGNAFWSSDRMQMVFGDGNEFLFNFTGCIDVIGHEMTHAVTEHTSPLVYRNQSGALNEHISDVFGIMVKQMVENETADEADWLIGEGCLLPGVRGVALRSMKNPGSAYNDPRFGKDPQPAHFSEFEPISEDRGGVHRYSGIPNKAFHLAAVAFGGFSWEKAGQIWWKTMTGGTVPPLCTFIQFADATVDVAAEEFGATAAKIVRAAWDQVGVTREH
ncbi:hypothetical protein QBC47DRAFT_437968 [Echria macrotheca]|uniref:Metalloprotease n=1 Tax=Echria macrotheca TaxID=438768 RepID=A0AAJ0FDY3_9PEZI|nr:hypothetical protein QBC47DRAFT_437968 [Echria macrotheca]